MKKGFTLIELLIVIGILAILATTVVLVLNPAQILAESRDTQRVSDLGSVQSAIGLLLATATTTVTFTAGPFCHGPVGFTCALGFTAGVGTLRTSRAIDSNGWVAVDLTKTSGGSPLSVLPADPSGGTANYHYGYAGDNAAKTYEINARLESTKLQGKMASDGGDDNNCVTFLEADCWYEVGTDPSLNL